MPTVEQLLVSFQGDEAVSGANAAAAALERAAKATEAYGKATDQSDQIVRRAGPSLEAIAARTDGAAAAAARIEAANNRFAASYDAVIAAMNKGDMSATQAAQTLERLAALRDQDVASAEAYASRIEAKFATIAAATDKATLAQQNYNKVTGVQTPTSSDDYKSRAKDIADYGSQLDALRAKFNPIFAASKQYEAVLNEIAEAQKVGAITAQEATAAQQQATDTFGKMNAPLNQTSAATNQAAFAMRQLNVQATQAISGIATGQGVFTVLIQQGHQVVDVMESTGTGFGTLVQGVKNTVAAGLSWVANNPIVTAAAAATVAIVAFGLAGERAAQQQASLRAVLSNVRDDFASTAEAVRKAGAQLSATTDLTNEEATTIASALARIPFIASSSFVSLGTMIDGLARGLGIDLPAATKLATEAFKDPAKAAADLATGATAIKQMDGATLDLVNHLVATGQQGAATQIVLGKMGEAAANSKANVTPLSEAWESVRKAWNGAASDGESLSGWLGKVMDAWIADMTRGLARVVGWVADVRAALAKLPNTGSGAAIPGEGGAPLETSMPNPGATFYTAPLGTNGVGANGLPLPVSGRNGALQNGASTALGLGQMTQPTQDFFKVDASDPTQAVQGIFKAFSYYGGLTSKTGAPLFQNQQAVNGAYAAGAGGATPANTAAYNAALSTMNVSQLPSDTAALIDSVGAALHATDTQIAAAKQIVMHESSGNQYYGGSGLSKPNSAQDGIQTVNVTTPRPTADDGSLPVPPIPPDQTAEYRQGQRAIAGATAASSIGTQADDLDKLTQKIKDLEAARDQIAAKGGGILSAEDAARVADYNQKIGTLKVQYDNIQDPTRQATMQLTDQAAAAGVLGDADRKLLETQQSISQHNRDNPAYPISDQQAGLQMAAVQNQLAAGATKLQSTQGLTITQNNALAKAWEGGAASAQDAQSEAQAFTTALQFYSTKSPDFVQHVADLKKGYDAVATSAHAVAVAQEENNNAFQASYLRAEISTLGMNDAARSLYLQHLKDEHDLRTMLGSDYDKMGPKLLQERDQIAQLNQSYQSQQAALSYLSNQFSQAFDTIGSAMTQAFVQGQGAAVNWRNVMTAVVQQVISAFLKLAVLNPILNAVFSQNNTTLFGALGALSGGGSATTAASSGSSIISTGGTVLSGAGAANSVYTAANGGTSILQSLGVTGENGVVTQAGNLIQQGTNYVGLTGEGGLTETLGLSGGGSAGQGVTGAITNFLNTPIGASVSAPGEGAVEAASAANVGGQGALVGTIGTAFAGFAAGYGAGSFAGSLVQGALNKSGPGPEIGAAAGAAIGVGAVLLAPETFGTSLLIGGLIGGTAGGIAGGLIGPHPSSPYSTIGVTTDPTTGLLNTGYEDHQKEDDTGEIQALQSDIATLNTFLTTTGIKVTNQGSGAGQFTTQGTIFQIGDNTPGGYQDPTKYSSLASAFPQLSFQTNTGDPVFNDYINKHAIDGSQSSTTGSGQFGSYQDLTNYVNAFVQAKAKLVDFFSNILPPLTATTTVTGTLNDAVTALNTSYLGAIATAKSLEGSVAASTDDTARLTQAEADLEAQRQAGIATANAAASAQVHAGDVSLTSRYLKAMATISGSAQDAVTASLYDFDQSVPQQRLDLTNSLVAIFGAGFVTTQYYADEMAELDKTLMAERAAIVTQGNAQITQAEQEAAQAAAQAAQQQAQALAQAQQNAESVVTSITSYVQKLQLGTSSALSPQAQYDLASSQFNAVAGAAQAGDYNSQTQITSYADALLTASRTVNGSGVGYATDTTRVIGALQGISDRSADQLTADALAAIQQSQTDQVVASLTDLKTVLTQMLAQLVSNGSRPSALAA